MKNNKESSRTMMMKHMTILKEMLKLDELDKQELLNQKEYLEDITMASNKRISELLEYTIAIKENARELYSMVEELTFKAKNSKRKYKNKLRKQELEYIRQIHLLKSELYDKIISDNTNSKELKTVIDINDYIRNGKQLSIY
jgi:hypothetical protein